jgi:hypothetical protein
MPSPVNRSRRTKAFNRGYERPQLFNPYKNAVLNELWRRGREARLKKTGGVLPPPPARAERRSFGRNQSPAARPQANRARRDRW